MTRRIYLLVALALAVSIAAAAQAADDAANKTALDLMPASTVVYFELPAPRQVIDTVLDHPLAKELEKHPDYQAALETPDMQQLRAVLKLVEDKLGTKWRDALTTLSGDGVHVGIDLSTQGVLVVVRSRDEKLLAKARDTFIELARADAKEKGEEDPIKTEEYRGVTAYKIEELFYATQGPWLVLTNKPMLGRMVINNMHGDGAGSLADEKQFQAALKTKQGKPTIWGYGNLSVLRATGIAQSIFNQKSDNPVGELLVGGILGAIPEAPFVTAAVELDANHVKLSVALPYDTKTVGQTREYYFGPEGKGAAPPLLSPQETILSLSTYRDFGQMWKHAPDLFNDDVNAKFAEAESGLATLFSGRSFPDDILANLEPGLQMVVTRQTWGEEEVMPQIKLPAVAVVFRMKKPEETARQFKITYQSLVGFLNIAGGMNKLEPLEQNTEKIGKAMIASAAYLPPDDKATWKAAGPQHNASPTVAFIGDKFILASTRKLAVELAEGFTKNDPAPTPGLNTAVKVDGRVLTAALVDNRAQLVAQNQLEKGHEQAAAEKEIDLLLKLIQGFRETSLDLTTKENVLRLSWEVKLGE